MSDMPLSDFRYVITPQDAYVRCDGYEWQVDYVMTLYDQVPYHLKRELKEALANLLVTAFELDKNGLLVVNCVDPHKRYAGWVSALLTAFTNEAEDRSEQENINIFYDMKDAADAASPYPYPYSYRR